MADWVLITGASGELGRELADIAAASGRNVILSGPEAEPLEMLAAALRGTYDVEFRTLPADLTKSSEITRLWSEATAKDPVAICINNASLSYHGTFADSDWKQDQRMIEVNVMATTQMMKLALKHMRKQGSGKILNIASVASFLPGPHMAVYHATKAYLLNLSEAVAEELRAETSKIRVTAACTGPVRESRNAAGNELAGTLIGKLPLPGVRKMAESAWGAMIAGEEVRVTGLSNAFLAFGTRLLPRTVTRMLAGSVLLRRA